MASEVERPEDVTPAVCREGSDGSGVSTNRSTKTCTRCKQSLPRAAYSTDRSRSDGLQATCNPCRSDHDQHRLAADPEYAKRTRANRTQWVKQRRLSDPLYTRRVRHNLSQSAYEEKMIKQNFSCAICCDRFKDIAGVRIDHSHACCPRQGSCGKCVRGILCQPCNVLLGASRENPETLRSAIKYLERWN